MAVDMLQELVLAVVRVQGLVLAVLQVSVVVQEQEQVLAGVGVEALGFGVGWGTCLGLG